MCKHSKRSAILSAGKHGKGDNKKDESEGDNKKDENQGFQKYVLHIIFKFDC